MINAEKQGTMCAMLLANAIDSGAYSMPFN